MTTKTPRTGKRYLRSLVKTAKGRSLSSKQWLERQINDPYVKQAREQGYRSRAAYKLIEIDEKYRFLKPGKIVIDLGAAPGGWSQICAEKVQAGKGSGKVIAIDLQAIEPIPQVAFLQADFLSEEAHQQLLNLLEGKKANIVLSDMAAASCGHSTTDHIRIMMLCEAAYEFAIKALAPGGVFVAKILRGGTENQLLQQMKQAFSQVKHIKPPASRSDSSEMYVVAIGFRGAPSSVNQ